MNVFIYNSLEHKMELTFEYLESIVTLDELESLVSGFDVDFCAVALFDAVANPLFSHRLAAILYYSLLIQANQNSSENMVRH